MDGLLMSKRNDSFQHPHHKMLRQTECYKRFWPVVCTSHAVVGATSIYKHQYRSIVASPFRNIYQQSPYFQVFFSVGRRSLEGNKFLGQRRRHSRLGRTPSNTALNISLHAVVNETTTFMISSIPAQGGYSSYLFVIARVP